jgi:hypothetical protein
VDAVIFAAIIGACFIEGTAPLGASGGSEAAIALTVAVNLAFCLVAALKGKYTSAVAGMLFPPIAWFPATRVGRPDSWWARRRYGTDGRRIRVAQAREQRHREHRRRLQDLIGGRPSERATADGERRGSSVEQPPPRR